MRVLLIFIFIIFDFTLFAQTATHKTQSHLNNGECSFLNLLKTNSEREIEQLKIVFNIQDNIKFIEDYKIKYLYLKHEELKQALSYLNDIKEKPLERSFVLRMDSSLSNLKSFILANTEGRDSALISTINSISLNGHANNSKCVNLKNQILILHIDQYLILKLGQSLLNPDKDLIMATVTLKEKHVCKGGYLEAQVKVWNRNILDKNLSLYHENNKYSFINNETTLRFKVNSDNGEESVINNAVVIEKTWNADVQVILNDNKILLIPIKEKYFVVKPVAILQNASVTAFYKDCLNEIVISVPGLGSSFIPKYTISDPHLNKLIVDPDTPIIGIVPQTDKVKINVFTDSLLIGEFDFSVRKIPFPNFHFSGYDVVNCGQVRVMKTPSLRVDLDLSEDCFMNYPKDSKFRIKAGKVKIIRNSEEIWTTTFQHDKNDYNFLFSNRKKIMDLIKPGDTISIEITEIERRTYERKWINFEFPPLVKTLKVIE